VVVVNPFTKSPVVDEPLIMIEPVTLKIFPDKVTSDDAVAAFVVPSDTSNLLPLALFIVLNPIPFVPEVPDVPELPDVPDEPVVPDEPDEPFAPDVPDEPFTPDVPDEPPELIQFNPLKVKSSLDDILK
jgi:hypothetical protein